MSEETRDRKSLVEQIFDEMFKNIEGREEFDVQTIEKLKQLAKSGDLVKPTQVIEIIKSDSGRVS